MFTDGSRQNNGATGYAVVWKNGLIWKSIKTHVGYNQEAYDAECAALARALQVASQRNTIPERVTISQTRRQPSGGWHRTNRGRDSSMPSKHGSILRHCGG